LRRKRGQGLLGVWGIREWRMVHGLWLVVAVQGSSIPLSMLDTRPSFFLKRSGLKSPSIVHMRGLTVSRWALISPFGPEIGHSTRKTSDMPKQKTRKSVAKRFKRTASGKFKRGSAGGAHILTGKSRKQKRGMRSSEMVSKSDHKRIARSLPV
jgi:large subunit ribosomal protein L35